MENYLLLSKQIIYFKDILSKNFNENALTAYEQLCIDFCAEWLNGKETFTLHTSGSTGIPKAIQLTRKQMLASSQATIKALHLKKNDNALVCINTNFVGGKMMLVRSLEIGMNILLQEPSANPLKSYVYEDKIDFAAFVPLQMQNILEESSELLHLLDTTKAIIVGGAAISLVLEQKIQKLNVPVFSTYGMTETVSHIALRKLNGADRQDFFQVLDDIEIQLNEQNCLQIKGAVTNQEWLTTNDVVELKSENTFVWIGRADNIINSGGIKIQIEKVEQSIDLILQGMNLHFNFFVAGLEDEKLGQKLVLLLETQMISIALQEEIIQQCKTQLTKYEVPKEIFAVSQFQRTQSDKIDRKSTLNLIKQ